MTMRIPLRCRCGKVHGSLADVSADQRARAVCYCDDCQIYALHLGRADILDERGGTDSALVTPAQLTLSEGTSELRCLRLSSKGPYRWYAGCCNTPLGNTLKYGLPFLVVPLAALDFAALGTSPEQALGPVDKRIHGRCAKGGIPPGAPAKVPLRMVPGALAFFVSGFVKGRAKPSPFHEPSGAPRAEPQYIDKSKREALRAEVLAAASA